MPQLRRNPITGHWVMMAENRSARPQEVEIQQVVRSRLVCPFCEGHEHLTPPEVLALRAADSSPDKPGWRVRVVPNKYPAVGDLPENHSPASLSAATAGNLPNENTAPGLGLHEIIVESPQHLTSLAESTDAQLTDVLEIYRQRLTMLRQLKKFRQVVVFKNGGPSAGATLTHLHSQLLALENSAPLLGDRLSNFESYLHEHHTCSLCDMGAEVSSDNRRLVAQTANFLAFCPWASRQAYETWVVPTTHAAHFDAQATESLPELASLLRAVLVKLQRIVKLPAYNYIVHTAPFDTLGSDHYHWHIEILPRTTSLAGFELGTGCYINAVLPEQAAAALREAK